MITSLASSKGLLALLLSVAGIGSVVVANIGGGDAEIAEPPPPASTPMAATMMRVGLDAERLAAVGITSQETGSTVAAAITEYATGASLAEADANYSACKATCSELEREVKSGLASPEDVTAYKSASEDLVTHTAAREAALDAIFEAGLEGLSADEKGAMRTIRDNAHWKLPVQYLTVERTEADWVKLRDYLDARRIAQEDGEEVPAEVTSFLATVESDGKVSGAKASLDSSLAAIQTAWNAAVTE
jgi:hypothetical protein